MREIKLRVLIDYRIYYQDTTPTATEMQGQ